MSKEMVQFNVDLTINEGKLDAFQGIVESMTAGTQKESGALGYEWYLSGDRKRCRVVENYKDADAVLAHMTSSVVRELVPKMLAVSRLDRFEVYGDPGPKAAERLAGIGAEIFQSWRGLGR
ncbi:MAG: antibiotic biosynthesis monooxygenase [Candidatus Sulfotelmatobacter sp.]